MYFVTVRRMHRVYRECEHLYIVRRRIIDMEYKARRRSTYIAEITVAMITVLWKEYRETRRIYERSRPSSLVAHPQGQGLQGQRVPEPGGVG